MNRYTVGYAIPEDLGAVADEIKHVKDLRLKMDKQVAAVKAREKELENYLIDNVSKDSGGAVGKLYTAKILTEEVASVEDWTKVHQHIAATGRFDLLSKSISQRAVKDTWEEGEEIPGVSKFNKVKLSIRKN